MDKYEYRAKTEQMLAYAEQKSYQKAMSIADTIDWRKVKNTAMLSTVSEIYENAGELGKARDTLFIAYDKAPSSRKVVYRLGIISLKLGHFDEAADCYEEFVKLAPKDPNQYILRYKILKAQKAPVKEQIEALEDFKHSEYVEKWAYELARLYAEAGMTSECLDECDDLILWFSEGTYVYQAMELKMKYKPLTPLQQEKYDHRNDGIGRKDSSKRKPSFRKSKGRPEPNPRIADKVRKDVHVTDSIDLPDLPEPMARTHASEPEAESQPKTRIRSTSDISTTISGASLSDALKAGVAVASGAVAPESASDDSQMTGKMKIEEILANWEATQRENAKILEKSQEEAEKEKALREKKKEEEEVLGATKPILSDDIRKLMEQLENGEEPEITDEDAEDFVDDEEDEATEKFLKVYSFSYVLLRLKGFIPTVTPAPHRRTDQSLCVACHEIDICLCRELCRADHISLILPVRVICHENDLSRPQIFDRFFDCVVLLVHIFLPFQTSFIKSFSFNFKIHISEETPC